MFIYIYIYEQPESPGTYRRERRFQMIYFSFVALVINPVHKIVETLHFTPDYIIYFSQE